MPIRRRRIHLTGTVSVTRVQIDATNEDVFQLGGKMTRLSGERRVREM